MLQSIPYQETLKTYSYSRQLDHPEVLFLILSVEERVCKNLEHLYVLNTLVVMQMSFLTRHPLHRDIYQPLSQGTLFVVRVVELMFHTFVISGFIPMFLIILSADYMDTLTSQHSHSSLLFLGKNTP